RIRIKSALDAIGVKVPSLRRTILEDRRQTQVSDTEKKPAQKPEQKSSPKSAPTSTQGSASDKKSS
ncbi:MAG: hypothetical protein KF742_02360, partial [Cryobacterium sp.]|nr:hypothetical protein [Cryobacterium sp.]